MRPRCCGATSRDQPTRRRRHHDGAPRTDTAAARPATSISQRTLRCGKCCTRPVVQTEITAPHRPPPAAARPPAGAHARPPAAPAVLPTTALQAPSRGPVPAAASRTLASAPAKDPCSPRQRPRPPQACAVDIPANVSGRLAADPKQHTGTYEMRRTQSTASAAAWAREGARAPQAAGDVLQHCFVSPAEKGPPASQREFW